MIDWEKNIADMPRLTTETLNDIILKAIVILNERFKNDPYKEIYFSYSIRMKLENVQK